MRVILTGPRQQLSPPRTRPVRHGAQLLAPLVTPGPRYRTSPANAVQATESPWTGLGAQGGAGWQKVYPDLADGPLVTGAVTVTDIATKVVSRDPTRRLLVLFNDGTATIEIVGPGGAYGTGVPLGTNTPLTVGDFLGDVYAVAAAGTTQPLRFMAASAATTPPA